MTVASADPYRGIVGASRVLVVDDEPVMLDTLVMALAGEFAVAGAATAEEALPILRDHPPEVLLLDKNLPGMTGLELLRIVRRDWPSIEVIIITAYASLESAVEALRLGACDYLIKPLPHISVVEEKVRWARDRRRLLRERYDMANQLLSANEELRQALELAKRSEALYRGLFDAVSDMVFVNPISPDRVIGCFSEVNRAACETLKFSREELLQKTVLDVLAPREVAALPGMLDLLSREPKVLYETEVVTRDGQGVPVEVHSHLFEIGGQRLLLSVARNIRDHILVEIERPGEAG
jgi:PAS domain S-box-containing protein